MLYLHLAENLSHVEESDDRVCKIKSIIDVIILSETWEKLYVLTKIPLYQPVASGQNC